MHSGILKQELVEMYEGKKMSSFEIAKHFSCSQNKIDYWIKKYKIKKRTISEAIYQKCNPHGDPFKLKQALTLKDTQLLGLGLGLYWGEGNKRNKHSVRLGNTNPAIIRSFIEFLIRIFDIKIEKLRFGLQVFDDMNTQATVRFWLKELEKFGINRSQFFKVIVTPTRSLGTYKEKSKYGVMTVHFSNTKLKNLIDRMLPL